ncbi:MAG: M23 family metallopeptidase [Patescibacteria group bacterium]
MNTQTMGLLQAAVSPDPNPAKGGGDITVVSGSALLSEDGPEGTALDVEEKIAMGHISLYVVRSGDSLSSIAKLFGVSKNTIAWANDISGGIIKPGQTLIILPISGVQHTVVKGDTIKSIAKKYKADEKEILQFNNFEGNIVLAIGEIVMVPDGEIATAPSVSAVTSAWRKSVGGPKIDGFYLRPILGGIRTQGLHGYNGVDLASFRGAPVIASATGVVLTSRISGWNAGYGQYIVVQHGNGTQTLYAHLSKNLVSPGERVVQGQVIGEMGATGKATGTHVHFEIRGAANPF